MSVVAGFDPTEIRLSDNAVNKLQVLMLKRKTRRCVSGLHRGGGCSGFQYGFTFDDNTAEDDWVIEREGVAALIDAMSYQYLMGSRLTTSRVSRVPSLSLTIPTRPPPVAVARLFQSRP